MACPFCTIDRKDIIFETSHSIAILDKFPVSENHTLVIPKRHVERIFGQLSKDEWVDICGLVESVRMRIVWKFYPDGFNIGINDGICAGQTVKHAHIHIIPRRKGDVPDPRGGVRWVIQDKAKYWEE